MKKYTLTEEHRKQLKPWAAKWIENAMSTRPIEEHEKPIIREHIKGLYRAAKLEPPPDNRIVFVQSPFIGRFVAGFAAGIWYLRKNKIKDINDATYAATSDATYAATIDATDAATIAATDAATIDATDAATRDATFAATYAATDAATFAATSDATDAATYAATDAATRDATFAATYAATDAATRDATSDATYAATIAATDAATIAATDAATYAATSDATDAATDAATRDATDAATRADKEWFNFKLNVMIEFSKELGNSNFFLHCAIKASKFYQGGNFWSGWTSFLSFFHNVVKLPIDYSKWIHYEKLAELSSFRYVHEKFCIVCDRPSKLLVDDQNRPHCEDGPFCEWRDGSGLYAWHGVRVPMYVIESPNKITIKLINEETNQEIKRVMIERYGVSRYLMEIGAEIVDMDCLNLIGSAPRALIKDKVGNQWLIGSDGSTARVYHMAVDTSIKTCKEAHELLCGFDESLITVEA